MAIRTINGDSHWHGPDVGAFKNRKKCIYDLKNLTGATKIARKRPIENWFFFPRNVKIPHTFYSSINVFYPFIFIYEITVIKKKIEYLY